MPAISKEKQKQFIVQDIKNNFHNSKAVIFYNFCKVEDREIFCLKRELKKIGSYWKIYKNSLVEKAFFDYSLKLKESNASIFCQEDEYKPLKILNKFEKDHPEVRRFQGGIYNQQLVENTLLEKWANLPSKEVLINTLFYYLNFHTRRLVDVLEKIKSAQETNQ
ncbi:50S ribosomal protein L10 [endosymbiont GvMRE of Glomus versiforme]|uniref:50S ribosomal protein L10 n=1 Tax=endosymbiont GvMRE of Glomus versiforme TaxID=2039283 RepID=UPI000ED4E11F|nr:50S ribosomal protein L10 [endosymbiont GvMRE of Glomus versiforme]RHZ35461.1 50S ribosomal protein L10 [endosymbiont GvMRE of Glomus versiforme]